MIPACVQIVINYIIINDKMDFPLYFVFHEPGQKLAPSVEMSTM